MKQNNYERVDLLAANPALTSKLRSGTKDRKAKRRNTAVSYSVLAGVGALALLTSLFWLPALADKWNDDRDLTAVENAATTLASEQVTASTISVTASLLSDSAAVLSVNNTNSDNEHQAQALLYMLNKMSNNADTLKVKTLEPLAIKKVETKVTKSTALKPTRTMLKQESPVSTTQATTLATTQATTEAPTTNTEKNNSDKGKIGHANYDSGYEDEDEFARTLTDRELMYYIVMSETGTSDFDSISLVAQIIANRVKYDSRGLRAVLKEPNQFACFENGSYKRIRPTQRVIEICDAALDGSPLGSYVLPSDVIFYCTVSYYKTQPAYFHSLKRILTHATQVFFTLADSPTPPMDNWTYETEAPKTSSLETGTEVELTTTLEN